MVLLAEQNGQSLTFAEVNELTPKVKADDMERLIEARNAPGAFGSWTTSLPAQPMPALRQLDQLPIRDGIG